MASAAWCSVRSPVWAQGQSCVRKAAGNLIGARMPAGTSAAFQLQPSPLSLSELSAALPTPAHIFHWFWILAWPWNCSIPMSGAAVPSPGLLATSGQWGGAVGRGPCSALPSCPPATCPGSAVARTLHPVAKALLPWKGSHDSCIKTSHSWFYLPFHCENNSESNLREKPYL